MTVPIVHRTAFHELTASNGRTDTRNTVRASQQSCRRHPAEPFTAGAHRTVLSHHLHEHEHMADRQSTAVGVTLVVTDSESRAGHLWTDSSVHEPPEPGELPNPSGRRAVVSSVQGTELVDLEPVPSPAWLAWLLWNGSRRRR